MGICGRMPLIVSGALGPFPAINGDFEYCDDILGGGPCGGRPRGGGPLGGGPRGGGPLGGAPSDFGPNAETA